MTTGRDGAADAMERALHLAEQARPRCPPNPAVGCVLIGTDGRTIGEGFTQPVGQAHAEIMALRDAAARGHSARGATAYITLEPCAHHGRTGPCCDALVAAGVARVVASIEDPNPQVRSKGFARLRAAGVDVAVGAGAEASRELNVGFFARMERGRPWVRLKVATSMDGRTALPNGHSQWITSEAAREDVQAWRARACAVLTGIGTVLADDPLLNVRRAGAERQPALVILDSTLRTLPDARLWSVPGREVLIYTCTSDDARRAALQARGARIVDAPASSGRVDLHALMTSLGQRAFNEVHVEAGECLNGGLLEAGVVDELLLYQAPMLLGEGAGVAALAPLTRVDEALRWDWVAVDRVGLELRLRLRLRPAPCKGSRVVT